MSKNELHRLRELLQVVVGGIETGHLTLALDASRKMISVLATCQAERPEAA